LYVPAPHGEHALPLAPVYPALHSQAVLEVLPAGEAESAGQVEQAAGPAPALYSSTPHCEQAPPSAPVWPALH
jgi:hypothetical protein